MQHNYCDYCYCQLITRISIWARENKTKNQSNSELKKKAKVKVKIIPKEIETATLHMVPETDIAVVVTTVVGIAELMFRN